MQGGRQEPGQMVASRARAATGRDSPGASRSHSALQHFDVKSLTSRAVR